MNRRLLFDRRALAALTFPQLANRYPHHARLLLWLRACWLLRREQLHALGWPDPSTRQNRNQGLRRLTTAQLIEPIDEQARVFKLGRRGAAVLQTYGFVSPYRATPRPRAQPGLLIAGEFAVALGCALMQHRHIVAMSWSEAPFAGAVVRPDAGGMLRYRTWPGSTDASASLESSTLTTNCIVRRGAKSLRTEQTDCDLRPTRSTGDEMVEM